MASGITTGLLRQYTTLLLMIHECGFKHVTMTTNDLCCSTAPADVVTSNHDARAHEACCTSDSVVTRHARMRGVPAQASDLPNMLRHPQPCGTAYCCCVYEAFVS